MELLTGMQAGEPDDKGELPEGTINWIALQLADLAQMRQNLFRPSLRARRRKGQRAESAQGDTIDRGIPGGADGGGSLASNGRVPCSRRQSPAVVGERPWPGQVHRLQVGGTRSPPVQQ